MDKLFVIKKHEIEIQNKNNKVTIVFKNENEIITNERRKIYIVCQGNSFLYVGETKTSIKERFNKSCYRFNYFIKYEKALNGYKGYKWLDLKGSPKKELSVYVAIFNEDYDSDEQRSKIEAIEGEIVYEIRKATGKWPEFQNEIHFSNVEESNKIALEILKQIEIPPSVFQV